MDMNDRQLRNVIDGLGGKPNGTPREDGFDITAASEIMAIAVPRVLHRRSQGAHRPHRRRPHIRRSSP